MISTLLPMNLEDQITLFLRSYVPKHLIGDQIDKFKFNKNDIVTLCKSCLEPLFKVTDDKFFEELYLNYAMIIMKIMKMDWNAAPD